MCHSNSAPTFRLPPLLDSLSVLLLGAEAQERLHLPTNRLVLRRAWPRSGDHLTLEYGGDGETRVVGRWFREAAQLEEVAAKVARGVRGAPAGVARLPRQQVMLLAGGADHRLPGLAPLVAQPGATLLVHRPERRAVLRLEAGGPTLYAKVVRPARVLALARAHQTVERLAAGRFLTPRLLKVDEVGGALFLSALPGLPLSEIREPAALLPAARAAGRALRLLHATPVPASVAAHTAASEGAGLARWVEWLGCFGAETAPFQAQAAAVAVALDGPATPASCSIATFTTSRSLWTGRGTSASSISIRCRRGRRRWTWPTCCSTSTCARFRGTCPRRWRRRPAPRWSKGTSRMAPPCGASRPMPGPRACGLPASTPFGRRGRGWCRHCWAKRARRRAYLFGAAERMISRRLGD